MEVKPIKLTALLEAQETAHTAGKVPLFLDKSGNVDRFFSYRHTTIVEAKKHLMSKVQGKTVEEVREDLRKELVMALKFGKTLLIRMTNSAVDFKGQFFEENTFPEALFDTDFGSSKDKYMAVVRESDLENRIFVPRGDKWEVVISSEFEAEDAEEFLKEVLPLEKCMLFKVED
uniref:Uncharacterized protein n=1 Tax=Chromera velia CCMP2878 TaxID=1169474 RepID=A0A0G4FUI3_9ALVE|eukprot:Cvel_18851.t1-p1 / transcript=Cvel_18851.t1 / gene=Cvel_18851 / organism=Chromera_velia_CCMP2878 / gene_product=hypothetical protein / transcript_product=hypothetical protein / location=Cvel_scaffold1585:16170-16688(-) / protein_length=173 / sequence_SO=supercontig / SO=protein_coding / is_pseudo=false